MRATLTFCILTFLVSQLYSQMKTEYPDIPRIDVHTHAGNDYEAIQKYLDLREVLLSEYDTDLAMWINLSDKRNPVTHVDSVSLLSQNRMLCAYGDYEAARG